MRKNISGIYIILNTKTNKVYIGQSVNIRQRWYMHRATLRVNKHYNFYLQSSWNKHGEKAFKFLILEYCTPDKLNERELNYLKIYMAKKMCYNTGTDPVAPMLGKSRKLSEETKRKIGEKAKGRVFSEEHKSNLSIAQMKRVTSDETKKKLSEALKGKPKPPRSAEHCRKISEVHKGKKVIRK